MEGLLLLYAAPTEYTALSLRDALAQAGVPCLVFCHEIPMEPGINFGADATYADVFVVSEDTAQASEIARDVMATLCAEDRGAETDYPRRINVRGINWATGVILPVIALTLAPLFRLGLSFEESIKRMNDLQGRFGSASGSLLILYCLLAGLFLLLIGALSNANRDLTRRLMVNIAAGLCGVIVMPLWLGYELLSWCCRQLQQLPARFKP